MINSLGSMLPNLNKKDIALTVLFGYACFNIYSTFLNLPKSPKSFHQNKEKPLQERTMESIIKKPAKFLFEMLSRIDDPSYLILLGLISLLIASKLKINATTTPPTLR